jgi:hypothetical protein
MNLKFEQHHFNNYDLDIEQVQNIFSIFEECLNILNRLHLQYRVTGSIALILNTNKIYRTPKDIDFTITEPFTTYEINLLGNNGFYYQHHDFNRFYFQKKSVVVEFHIDNNVMNNINVLSYNGFLLETCLNKYVFEAKKRLYDNRQKDIDDLLFYDKFV